MVDISVKSGAAWACPQGCDLADVLLPVHVREGEEDLGRGQGQGDQSHRPVLLEQTEEGSPCVLTLRCGSSAAIGRLLVVSEARTVELYDQAGDYCGTERGDRDDGVQHQGEDRGPFYRTRLILDQPCSACEVKLLSLGGRSSVLVLRVFVGLTPLLPRPVRVPGIDMEQVQCLVEEMGTSLSPGAQNLMEMVHFQQKNQTASLGGLLPLLMGGGALSALARGATPPSSFSSSSSSAAPPGGPVSPVSPADGAMSTGSSSSPDSVRSENSASGDTGNHAHLAEMMSQFLKGQHGQASNSGPDFLPMLQSVCGQVTQLRLDGAEEGRRRNGSWELDSAMERRLEDMERRLKEHVDRRLDALEQKLEKALLGALPLAAPAGPVEQGAATPGGHALTSGPLEV